MPGIGIGTSPYICTESESSEIEDDRIQSVTRTYTLYNFATRFAAESALLLSVYCPSVDFNYTQCLRRNVNVTKSDYESTSGTDVFNATVKWVRWLPRVVGLETLTGGIQTTTQRVKVAYSHIADYTGTGNDAIEHGLINVTENGSQGVDIAFPIMGFTLNRLYAKNTVTLALMATLMSYVERPNNAIWRGFDPGTIKITNINLSNAEGEFDSINWTFAASPNYTNLVIPSAHGDITVTSKLGWQYLHITEKPVPGDATNGGYTTHAPHTAHVEEMTPGANLNDVI